MHLVILCEGATEERVLKNFLAPYCEKFTGIEIQNLRGSGNLKQEFSKRAELALQDDPEAYVLCLIDLLEAPFKLPKAVRNDPNFYHAQFTFIQQLMQKSVKESVRDRFLAFPVVMELETWMLADAQAISEYFQPHKTPSWPNPENVIQPASELSKLMREIRTKKYQKTLHGPALFKKVSAERVYKDTCPHFNMMIDELLRIQGLAADSTLHIPLPNEDLVQKAIELQQRHDALWAEIERRGDLTNDECGVLDGIEREMEQLSLEFVESYRQ